MEGTMEQFTEKLAGLVELGKKNKNFLEYAQIDSYFKDMKLDSDMMEAIYDYLEQNGIDVLTLAAVADDDEDLDDLAEAKGLDFSELLDEIEAIVYSGTKLNIDYFIEEVVDDDHVDDIYDYFMESDTDDLNAAQDELGEDYNEDEIRLVRIKFLSEQAN